MHPGEMPVDAHLVRRLVTDQSPQWSTLSIVRVASSGTDNAMFRLGDKLVARLPRIDWARDAVEREQRWLPLLAPHLPVAVPAPVAPQNTVTRTHPQRARFGLGGSARLFEPPRDLIGDALGMLEMREVTGLSPGLALVGGGEEAFLSVGHGRE